MQVINPSPRILCISGDQFARVAVHRNTGYVVLEIHLFENTAGSHAVEKVDGFPCRHGENTRVVLPECQTVQLAGTDGTVDSVLTDGVARA